MVSKLKVLVMGIFLTVSISANDSANDIEESGVLDKNFFVFIGGGISYADVSFYSVTSPAFANMKGLNKQAENIELGIGYKFNDRFFSTLSFKRSMFDIANIDNIYTSFNYQMSDILFKPYIGILFGYSSLNWEKDPDTVNSNKSLVSNKFMYGFTLGGEYKLASDWSVYMKYQYIKHDHKIDIYTPGYKNIEHKYEQDIIVGLKYVF
jgi:opacity protein-like surface antigen